MRFPLVFYIFSYIFLPLNAQAKSSDWAESPQPAYPLHAALEGTSGEVKLRVVVNSDGQVREVVIVKGSGKQELDYAARAAVLKWRLNKSKIKPGDLAPGREVIVDFRETEKERRIAGAVLRRASQNGSAWKHGGYFSFPPEAVYPDAQKTARIRFTIAPDGHPRLVQIVQSSGSSALDAAAVKGIQMWQAYPEWVGETAEVPVTFEAPGVSGLRKSRPSQSEPINWEKYVTFHPTPDYPYEARARHMTGTGLYLITFGKEGNSENVQILQSTGYPILDSSVLQAFKRWRSIPNSPYPQAKIPVTFTMRGQPNPSRWRLGQPELIGAKH